MPCHLHDPSPIPNHDDENAGCKECFHGKPDFCEAAVLMDTLKVNLKSFSAAFLHIANTNPSLATLHLFKLP